LEHKLTGLLNLYARFAAAVGGLATTKLGAQPSLTELAAVKELLASVSFSN